MVTSDIVVGNHNVLLSPLKTVEVGSSWTEINVRQAGLVVALEPERPVGTVRMRQYIFDDIINVLELSLHAVSQNTNVTDWGVG